MKIKLIAVAVVVLWLVGLSPTPFADTTNHIQLAAVSNAEAQMEPVVTEEAPPVKLYPDINITINLPARELTVKKDGAVVLKFPCSIGALAFKSPVMSDKITQLIWNPWWIPPNSPWARGAKPEAPGPRNCLGPVKMLLGQGVRIHGTNKPSSVGRAASHGCFRMINDQAAELAWYLQQNLSSMNQETYKEKYAKNRYQSYYVNLDTAATVDIVYKPVEFVNDSLVIYPDIYGWAKNYSDEISAALLTAGVQPELIDQEMLKGIKAARGEKQVIPISQLMNNMPMNQTSVESDQNIEPVKKRKHH